MYEAIQFPDQTAAATATARLENQICLLGFQHGIYSDQGRIFDAMLFKTLNQALQVDKTRTIAFGPQSNAVVERIDRTVQSTLAKCNDREQSHWSKEVSYIVMVYRTSIHESIG